MNIHICRTTNFLGRHKLKFLVFTQSLQASVGIGTSTTTSSQIFSNSIIYHPPNRCHMAKSMKLRPSWEAPSLSATLQFAYILCYRKVHYRVHNIPPIVPLPWASWIPSYISHTLDNCNVNNWRTSPGLCDLQRLNCPRNSASWYKHNSDGIFKHSDGHVLGKQFIFRAYIILTLNKFADKWRCAENIAHVT